VYERRPLGSGWAAHGALLACRAQHVLVSIVDRLRHSNPMDLSCYACSRRRSLY